MTLTHPLTLVRTRLNIYRETDDTLIPIISYLENEALPRLQKDVHRLLLTAPDYCLNDGILYHSRVAKSKRTQEMTVFQLVLAQITKISTNYQNCKDLSWVPISRAHGHAANY